MGISSRRRSCPTSVRRVEIATGEAQPPQEPQARGPPRPLAQRLLPRISPIVEASMRRPNGARRRRAPRDVVELRRPGSAEVGERGGSGPQAAMPNTLARRSDFGSIRSRIRAILELPCRTIRIRPTQAQRHRPRPVPALPRTCDLPSRALREQDANGRNRHGRRRLVSRIARPAPPFVPLAIVRRGCRHKAGQGVTRSTSARRQGKPRRVRRPGSSRHPPGIPAP
jgi:hypothetical protein